LTFSFAGGTMLQCEAAPMLNRLRRGGSLVELLISLGIIGALVGLVLTAAMSLLNAVNRLVQ
jgi:type II secretory pathway pseudopilin PulG